MPNYTTSSNMGLTIPIPGTTPGPEYASLNGACLTTIDGHDHSSGKGVPITPNGINISSDLSFGSNNATLLRSIRFDPQNSALSNPSDIGCLYEAGVDLYYNDGNGNQIRITQSGSVTGSSGTITGLPSGTASAAYQSVSGTFQFQSATNTPANIDGASIIIRNQTASSNGITLSAPTALASNYGLTLPAVPGATSVMTLDSAGAMGTITYPFQTASYGDGTITAAKLAAGVIPNLQSQTFTSNGNFTVPANVTKVIAIGCGGGAGGAAGGYGSSPNWGEGGFGGDGAELMVFAVSVTPGDILPVVIGAGGSGGAANGGGGGAGGAGSDGSDTTFSGNTFPGGKGYSGGSPSAAGTLGGTSRRVVLGTNGGQGPGGKGGAGGNTSGSVAGGAGAGYGAGGGGGGGGNASNSTAGGAGYQGFLTLFWTGA